MENGLGEGFAHVLKSEHIRAPSPGMDCGKGCDGCLFSLRRAGSSEGKMLAELCFHGSLDLVCSDGRQYTGHSQAADGPPSMERSAGCWHTFPSWKEVPGLMPQAFELNESTAFSRLGCQDHL